MGVNSRILLSYQRISTHQIHVIRATAFGRWFVIKKRLVFVSTIITQYESMAEWRCMWSWTPGLYVVWCYYLAVIVKTVYCENESHSIEFQRRTLLANIYILRVLIVHEGCRYLLWGRIWVNFHLMLAELLHLLMEEEEDQRFQLSANYHVLLVCQEPSGSMLIWINLIYDVVAVVVVYIVWCWSHSYASV